MATKKTFDVVVWGATGFTGKLVAEYVASSIVSRQPSLKWAIAGRNYQKLKTLQDSLVASSSLPSVPDILVGDSGDQSSVDNVVKSTNVVISTAGPFYLHGPPVVDACVRFKSDYVDISGETPWAKMLIDKYHAQAEAEGIHIVPMCGYDSVPSDLGTYLVAKQLKEKYGEPCRSVKGFALTQGTFSGGTVGTGVLMDSKPELREQLKNPFLLGGITPSGIREEDQDIMTPKFQESMQAWTGPFMMAGINTRVVRRSHSLLDYGRDFSYNEVALCRDERMAKAMVRQMSASVEYRKKKIEEGSLPKPGEGPSAEVRAKSSFKFYFEGKSEGGKTAKALISGGDPGYTETAKMISEAAACLFSQKNNVLKQCKGGVVTPAVAFGDLLVTSLVENGIGVEVDGEKVKVGGAKL